MSRQRVRRPPGPTRLWPSADYYRELEPDDGEHVHPVDLLIEGDPAVRRAYRRARRLERKVRVAPGAEAAFRTYVDAQLETLLARETVSFNIGVEVGALGARAEEASLAGERRHSRAKVNAFRRSVRTLLLGASIPAAERLLVFLESVYALGRGAVATEVIRGAIRARGPSARNPIRRALSASRARR